MSLHTGSDEEIHFVFLFFHLLNLVLCVFLSHVFTRIKAEYIFYFSVPHLSVGISTLVFLVYEMFCHLNYMDVTVLADKLAVDTSVIVFLTCDYLGMLNPQNAI